MSLGINIAVGAVVGLHLYREREHDRFWPPPGPPPANRIFEEISCRLPASDAALFRQVVGPHIQKLDTARQAMDDFSMTMHDSLLKEPFDAAAYQQESGKMIGIRDTMSSALGAVFDSVSSAALQMSPEGRKALAEATLPPPHYGPPPPNPCRDDEHRG